MGECQTPHTPPYIAIAGTFNSRTQLSGLWVGQIQTDGSYIYIPYHCILLYFPNVWLVQLVHSYGVHCFSTSCLEPFIYVTTALPIPKCVRWLQLLAHKLCGPQSAPSMLLKTSSRCSGHCLPLTPSILRVFTKSQLSQHLSAYLYSDSFNELLFLIGLSSCAALSPSICKHGILWPT